jgi:hypothetical protein
MGVVNGAGINPQGRQMNFSRRVAKFKNSSETKKSLHSAWVE